MKGVLVGGLQGCMCMVKQNINLLPNTCTEGLREFHTLQLPSDVTGTCSDVRWQLSHLEALVVALHVLLNAQSCFFLVAQS